MKSYHKLCALLWVALGVQALSAQTDVTKTYLKNADFEQASAQTENAINVPPGWTMVYTVSGWNDGKSVTDNGSRCYNFWAGTISALDMYQKSTLPAGKYTLSADFFSDVEGGNQRVYASVGGIITESPAITVGSWNTVSTEFYNASESEVTLGILSSGWFKVDNVRLLYWGFDLTEALKALEVLIAEAESLATLNPMGTAEVDALNAAIAMATADITSEEEMNDVVEVLNEAIAGAQAWLVAYDEAKAALVAALDRFETDFNDGENGALRYVPAHVWDNVIEAVAAAVVAKDMTDDYLPFVEAAAGLNAALDEIHASYMAYGMLEECTSLIANANCKANDGWPGSGRTTTSGQHWSGVSSRAYFTQNHEDGAARSQTITLPKSGTYLLKVSVRAVEEASYAEILVNGVSHKVAGAHGRKGGTIATDGSEWESVEAGIVAGKRFANGNKGYGWVYANIYFEAEAGANTIAINLSNANSSREANCGGMELYYLRPNYVIEEGQVATHYGEYDEAIVATHATHVVTNATLTIGTVDVAANPNTLIIAHEGQVSNETNVIVDGQAASLVITDGFSFHTSADFMAGALSYGHEYVKDAWYTVCLPFAYAIPEGVTAETLTIVDLNGKAFVFDEVAAMEANKPYMIKNGTEVAGLFASLTNIPVVATPDTMSIAVMADGSTYVAEFIGTYTPVTTDALMEDGTYDILYFDAEGQLRYLSEGVTDEHVSIAPFTCYIRLPKGAADWSTSDTPYAVLRHGGDTTDIEPSILNPQPSTEIYDLMGRKVTTMAKGGIYIVNGRKVAK